MANSDYNISNTSADFTPMAELGKEADYLDRTLQLGRANFPRTDSLKIGMAALCDEEFMQVTGLGPGTVAVKRGCGDTVPAKHLLKTLIWFIGTDVVGTDGIERTAGDTTGVKYQPYTTGGGSYPLDKQAPDEVVYNWRFFRPYPPGAMRVRGQRWYIKQLISSEQPNMTVTWAHRDRILEADRLIDHDIGNIGPEPGTTYTVRIYNKQGQLKRTEVGIMAKVRDSRGRVISPSWNYTWAQAMQDLGFNEPSEDGTLVDGYLTLFSTREGFDSWQGYTIEFTINTQGKLIKVAQVGQQSVQDASTDGEPPLPPLTSVSVSQQAQMAAQSPTAEDEGGVVASDAVYVTQFAEGAGQETSFYTPLNRNLFETPYTIMVRRGISGFAMLTTVVARPSDRLTDSHSIYARYDYPKGNGATLPYLAVVSPSYFTPWATLGAKVAQLDEALPVRTSSFYDGVPLSGVQVGSVALIDAEIVVVTSVSETSIGVKRGCMDTVPAQHNENARLWFFETQAGFDPTDYPLKNNAGELGAAVQVKMVPDVFGPPLNMLDVPTDRLDMKRRMERPFAPGNVLVDGKRWYLGAQMKADTSMIVTWDHRNRVEQAGNVVDHLGQPQNPEVGQSYLLSIKLTVKPKDAPSYVVVVREEKVEGTQFEYTWDMAVADGYRAGSILGACGTVTVGFLLEAVRDGLTSWQGYVIPVRLPSYVCAPGQSPGGGQLPGAGNGNGTVGSGTPGGSAPGGDDQGDGPRDPIDNGGGGDNGSGPPPPPEVPPDWPDPIEPPPVDPNDPNPALAAHWDLNWDRHWDAYTKDDQGDN